MGMLPKLLAGLGASRAFVVCGKTAAGGPLLKRVLAVLGERCAGVFNEVSAHTPLPMVERALAALRAARADAIISVGGGSAIDAGKGLALLGMATGPLDLYRVRYGSEGEMAQERLPRSGVPHIAIPTTSGSASEVMPTSAIRDIVQLKKLLFWDDALIPQAVILDPEMAIHTGPFLSASAGMTAVARCVESLYSASRNPVTDGLALHALRLLYRNLPVVVDRPDDLDARFACQVACAMSGIAAINSMVSIVHALGHIVGGKYGLQHGVFHSILLAPAMRQMLPVIGGTQHLVLDALGGGEAATADEAGAAAADRVQALVSRLPLKSKLRELGITAEEISDIAAQGSHDYMMANLPRPMSVPDIEALLRKAW
jgi:alcohol dehydrogenase class IV